MTPDAQLGSCNICIKYGYETGWQSYTVYAATL